MMENFIFQLQSHAYHLKDLVIYYCYLLFCFWFVCFLFLFFVFLFLYVFEIVFE